MSIPVAVVTPVANHEPAQQIVQVEVASLKMDNIREDLGTPEEIDQLGDDLVKGQLVPIILQPDGTILDGHRRALAAKKKGIQNLNAIRLTKHMSRDEASQFQLRNSEHRKGFNDYERFKALKLIQAAHSEWSKKRIGEEVSMPPPKVTELLTEGIPAVEAAFREGKITLGIRYEIAKASIEQQAEILAGCLSGSTSRDKIVTARKRKTSDQPEEKVSRARLALPNAVITVATEGEGMTVTGIIEVLTALLKECREAEKAGISAKSLQATLKDKATKAV